jgi:hypothetical protein
MKDLMARLVSCRCLNEVQLLYCQSSIALNESLHILKAGRKDSSIRRVKVVQPAFADVGKFLRENHFAVEILKSDSSLHAPASENCRRREFETGKKQGWLP